ncbi:OmpA family protein [Marinomonas sp. A79]|uniref:OmpA family protein n=1 Tax=Marinomonas vulgaris TaxID=2823372 RepID=A0ABS5H8K9_9GAMM|nr:OmpA family protein [Marinomonas vulgaris]MBR7887890.1 OmpA family protein [Marinomonas vulgaris]
MKLPIRIISIVSMLFAFQTHYTIASETLYTSDIQPRLADADKDGVIDARDLCPGTPISAAIDNNGCSNQVTKLLSVELNVLFDSGKSDIKPRFYSELKSLADFLKSNPNSNVVIEGHTDSDGSAELNLNLSQQRASAISNVLIDSFRIDPSRVKGIGYGESRPISENDTAEGRELNRRVVAEVFAQQQFANERWTIYSIDNENTAFNSK